MASMLAPSSASARLPGELGRQARPSRSLGRIEIGPPISQHMLSDWQTQGFTFHPSRPSGRHVNALQAVQAARGVVPDPDIYVSAVRFGRVVAPSQPAFIEGKRVWVVVFPDAPVVVTGPPGGSGGGIQRSTTVGVVIARTGILAETFNYGTDAPAALGMVHEVGRQPLHGGPAVVLVQFGTHSPWLIEKITVYQTGHVRVSRVIRGTRRVVSCSVSRQSLDRVMVPVLTRAEENGVFNLPSTLQHRRYGADAPAAFVRSYVNGRTRYVQAFGTSTNHLSGAGKVFALWKKLKVAASQGCTV